MPIFSLGECVGATAKPTLSSRRQPAPRSEGVSSAYEEEHPSPIRRGGRDRDFRRRCARAAGDAQRRRQAASHRHGSRVAVDRGRGAQGDDADAGRRASGDRHLSPEERDRQGSDRLGENALQLQLLGHPERRAGRHERAADRRQARLRLRRAERAWSFLLGRQLRHPWIEDRRIQHGRLVDEAGVVERQDRDDRLLVDRRVSNGRGRARSSRIRGDERAGLRRRCRPRWTVLRTRQLVSRRRGADAVHRVALRRAEPGAADVSSEHVARGFDPRVEVVRPRATPAAGGLVERALASADAGHHQKRGWPARHLRDQRCRSKPAAR